MSLTPGSTIGPFKIQSLLGKGGMGEVFSAVDTRLDRGVALKILPAEFASDPNRLRRFQLEARTLATLNHPNVALLFGFEEHASQNLLVLELIEGESLDDRLRRGGLPLEEAVETALQIASALEAAHDKGIIHRDLKPANIKITSDGHAKVLDFGLAKLAAPDPSSTATVLADSPTLLTASTLPGVILGTAGYMSPEQAKGKSVDKRTDIWSFGCVLYECLTGQKAFGGESLTECLAAVLHREPDWSALPENTPIQISALLRRCLARDRQQRLHDIADARLELEAALSAPLDVMAPKQNPRAKIIALISCILGAALGALALFLLRPERAASQDILPRQSLIRLSGLLKPNIRSFHISPDGKRLAYITDRGLFIRNLTEAEGNARLVADSEGATCVFWSPDSQSLGFAAGKRLFRVRAEETRSQAIADVGETFTDSAGAAWLANNKIIFTAGAGTNGLREIPATGGSAREFLAHNPQTDMDFHFPEPLPDGKNVMFVVHRGTNGVSEGIDTIAVSAGGTRKIIYSHPGPDGINFVSYSPSGHILFDLRPAVSLWALPFSLSKLEVTGSPILLEQGTQCPSVAEDGTIIRRGGIDLSPHRLAVLDRAGKLLETIGPAKLHSFQRPRWSPDGQKIATEIFADNGESSALWIFDQTNNVPLPVPKVTFAAMPAWSHDGSMIAFAASDHVKSPSRLVFQPLTGAEPMITAEGIVPMFTPGGGSVVFLHSLKAWFTAPYEIRSLNFSGLGASNASTLLYRSEQEVPMMPDLSPDGDLIAFVSAEKNTYGDSALCVAPFPSINRKYRIPATKSLFWPVWRNYGGQLLLFFEDQDGAIFETPVSHDANQVSIGQPRLLFERNLEGLRNDYEWPPGFDVSQDGQRFLVHDWPEGAPRETFLRMVQNVSAFISEKR